MPAIGMAAFCAMTRKPCGSSVTAPSPHGWISSSPWPASLTRSWISRSRRLWPRAGTGAGSVPAPVPYSICPPHRAAMASMPQPMPSTGTPSVNTASGTGRTACTSDAAADRMMPVGAQARILSSSTVAGRISQYTCASRTWRANRRVPWPPQSRIRIFSACMSRGCVSVAGTAAPWQGARAARLSVDAVVRCFLDDLHVMHVGFLHAGSGNLHESRPRAHLLDVVAASVAQGGAQAADQLMHDGAQRPLVRHAPFHALGHQFLDLLVRVLEVAICGAAVTAHGADRAHATVVLVGASLEQLDFAGRFLG